MLRLQLCGYFKEMAENFCVFKHVIFLKLTAVSEVLVLIQGRRVDGLGTSAKAV